jgi:hypothetical protein
MQNIAREKFVVQMLLITLFVGFEVLTAVVMKSSVFWDTTLRSPLEVNRRFDVHPKRRLTFNGIHGVISQKTELFTRSFDYFYFLIHKKEISVIEIIEK